MNPTLLIAEHDPELTELYQRYLVMFGYRILTASSGIECLSIIRNESPCALVTSVDLPWDGTEGLLDYLREESRQHRVPSVILTGCTADENVAELREETCVFRYLRKPFLMGRLLECIRAIESDCSENSQQELSSLLQPFGAACN